MAKRRILDEDAEDESHMFVALTKGITNYHDTTL